MNGGVTITHHHDGRVTCHADGVTYSAPAGFTFVSEEEYRRLQLAAALVANLDRSPHGRHEGDTESQTPGGVSLGNPHVREGEPIGYDIGGHPIVMPERGRRHDPAAWFTRPQS